MADGELGFDVASKVGAADSEVLGVEVGDVVGVGVEVSRGEQKVSNMACSVWVSFRVMVIEVSVTLFPSRTQWLKLYPVFGVATALIIGSPVDA